MLTLRPRIDIFVNREVELRRLMDLVLIGAKVLLIGLRGYGKTSLLVRFLDILESENKGFGIYVNCLRVYSGKDLLLEVRGEIERIKGADFDLVKELEMRAELVDNPRDALDIVFDMVSKAGASVLIFDEVSMLIQRFALQKPFRGMGGSRAVASHLKSLLEMYDFSVIFSDTSISALHELFEDYTSPLFRAFDAKIVIEPLSLEDSMSLVRELLRKRGITLGDEELLIISELSGGVPQYIRMITALMEKGINREAIIDTVGRDLEQGFLNEYFSALLDKFSWNEQEVLLAISKGLERFSEIERNVINAAQALESLLRKNMIMKVRKSRKDVRYLIKDRLFKMWLALQETPRFKKMSIRRAKLCSLGLEALARELFLTLERPVRIRDVLGRTLLINPTREVKRYEGSLGEIDLIAISKEGETYVGEIYSGFRCKKEKVDELLKNMSLVERMGYKNIKGLLITYFEFPNETIGYAKKLVLSGVEIYLLTYEQLKEISKYSQTRIW